jgi:predicted RNase H-like nuclease (RuvC/YqgF family)
MQEEATNQVEERVEDEGEVVELDVPESDDSDSDEAIEDVSAEEGQKASKEDELEDYSKSVQKRIATLTKKMREQERAAQSAYEYAKNLQAENEKLKTNTSELNKSYFGEAESRLKSQRAQANAVLKQAYQDQDWDKVTKAQEILDKITVEESKLVNNRMKVEQPEPTYQNYNPQQFQQFQQPQAAPEPDPAAQEWAEKKCVVWRR